MSKKIANTSEPRLSTPYELDWDKIDPDIRVELRIMREHGIETTESCQGGHGHPYPEPTIRFAGGHAEGYRAVGIALTYGLKVQELRRVWPVINGELTGPQWEMTFRHLDGAGTYCVEQPNGTVKFMWR